MWKYIKQSDLEWIENIQDKNLVQRLVCQYESGRPIIKKSYDRLVKKYQINGSVDIY